MDIESQINSLRLKFTQNHEREAGLMELQTLINNQFPQLITPFMTVLAAYQKNENENNQGIISGSVYNLTFNQSIQRFNALMDRILEEERRLYGDNAEGINELSIFQCDRRNIVKHFDQRFEEKEDWGHHIQFYLIYAQKYAQPESLVKRLISSLKEEKGSVKFGDLDSNAVRHIEIGRGDNNKDGPYFFRKAFNKRIKPQVKLLEQFDSNVDQHYPRFQGAQYLPFAYAINYHPESFSVVKHLINWLLNTFCNLKSPSRRYVFFLIIDPKEINESPPKRSGWFNRSKKRNITANDQKTFQLLKEFEQGDERMTVLPQLTKIRLEDIEDWYRKYESNEIKRDEKIREIVQNLGGGDSWDMSHVERELDKLVQEILNQKFGI